LESTIMTENVIQEKQVTATIADKTANPAPLGLLAFGMTTVLLNLHNSGLWQLDATVLAMGIFYGAIAQIIAGIAEFKKGNTFGMTAFCSFGLFWLTLVFVFLTDHLGLGDKFTPSAGGMAAYLIVWGFFTFFMYIATLRLNRGLQVIFLSLSILFWLLAAHKLLDPIGGRFIIGTIAGIEGVFCGGSAIYLAIAQIWNEIYGREVLPIGPYKRK
jgi:succinate-acetate transporter protein